MLGFGDPLVRGIQNTHALLLGLIHHSRVSLSLRMTFFLSRTMSELSWWLLSHCFIDQAPVTPLQDTLVSEYFLPAYLMELGLLVRSSGHVLVAFYPGKKNLRKRKKGQGHSQAIIHF